ncbi:hypothetical protein L2E82_50547 [Cichorium intybus]|nr:hypothetical protein L2E82_50547 [Cichorium intybus]
MFLICSHKPEGSYRSIPDFRFYMSDFTCQVTEIVPPFFVLWADEKLSLNLLEIGEARLIEMILTLVHTFEQQQQQKKQELV